MTVHVLFFARARDLVGASTAAVEAGDAPTVGALRRRLVEQWPALAPLQAHLMIAVNNEYAPDEQSLAAEDEVACFPPVSGG